MTRQLEEVFDDHVEALAPKPGESLEHFRRGSVQPSLIHVRDHEPVQKRGVSVRATARVIRHHIVRGINTETVLRRYATSDRRLTRTAPSAEPVDVLELFPKLCTIGSLFVLFGSHARRCCRVPSTRKRDATIVELTVSNSRMVFAFLGDQALLGEI